MSRQLWFLVCGLWAFSAHAGVVETSNKARELLRSLRFPEAAQVLREGIALGGATPPELAVLYSLWGEAEASMASEERAVELFARALTVDPTLAVDPQKPPKVQRAFLRARARLNGQAIHVQLQSVPRTAAEVHTTMNVQGDVLALALSARLRPQGAPPVPISALPKGEVRWRCVEKSCAFVVELLDEFGNVLHSTSSSSDAVSAPPESPAFSFSSPAPVAPPAPQPRVARWVFLAGTVALGAASGVLAWQFSRTQSELIAVTGDKLQHRYQEAQSLDTSRRTLQASLIATTLGACGAATATVLTW